MKKLLMVLLVPLALTACNDNDDPAMAAKPNPTPTVTQVDNFTQSVQTEVAASSDDAEPKDLDTIALAAPEDAEPVPVN